jgi:glycosidase
MKDIWYQINPSYISQIPPFNQSLGSSIFQKVELNLEYIKNLGCNGLWFMPLYVKGQLNKKGFGSPYSIQDYEISAEWGTKDELRGLIQKAHSLGLRALGEYVPNHLAQDAKFIIENGSEVVYTDERGNFVHDHDWHDVVKLNHSSQKVQDFTRNNLLELSHLGFDGFRLDMAHYPAYPPEKPFAKGEPCPDFWKRVLNSAELKKLKFIAEVYDDKNQELKGYKDHFELINCGMEVYDKKLHDLLAQRLKFDSHAEDFQKRFYEELHLQYQITHLAGIDEKKNGLPFLRFASNHDDSPGVKNFGGVKNYLFAFELLAYLSGDLMIYAGDERGLAIKPSVVGINNDNESKEISFVSPSESELIHERISHILRLISSNKALSEGMLLVANIAENNNLVSFARFDPLNNELVLVVANLSSIGSKQWGKIEKFFPTFDFPIHQFTLNELIEWVNPKILSQGGKVVNLKESDFVSRPFNHHEEFWVGLEPLEVQLLKITFT